MVQLDSNEITQLFDFVKTKNVPFIDVRYEIVDHLASGIEESMAKDESLDFEKALSDIYGQFPITGFAQLQIEKEKMLKHYWVTRMIDYLKLFFTPPRVIFTLMLTGLMYLIFSLGNNMSFVLISFAFILLGTAISKFGYKDTKELKDSYLVFKSYYSASNLILGFAFALPFFVTYQSQWFLEVNIEPLYMFASFYYALALIVCYAVFWIFPKMMSLEINTKYKHLMLT